MILVVILLLSLEMVVVILAVCLCLLQVTLTTTLIILTFLLQRDRGDKGMQQVVVVREGRQQGPRSCCHEEDMVPRHQHRHL